MHRFQTDATARRNFRSFMSLQHLLRLGGFVPQNDQDREIGLFGAACIAFRIHSPAGQSSKTAQMPHLAAISRWVRSTPPDSCEMASIAAATIGPNGYSLFKRAGRLTRPPRA